MRHVQNQLVVYLNTVANMCHRLMWDEDIRRLIIVTEEFDEWNAQIFKLVQTLVRCADVDKQLELVVGYNVRGHPTPFYWTTTKVRIAGEKHQFDDPCGTLEDLEYSLTGVRCGCEECRYCKGRTRVESMEKTIANGPVVLKVTPYVKVC